MRPARLASLALIACLGLAGCGSDSTDGARDSAGGARPVDLALDFQPNAAHAGIYAAAERGVDRDHGVDLRVRVPASSTDSLKLLAGGRADVSIVDIHDLGLARERGADVVGIGALIQRPLAAVIAKPEIRRPRELEGRRVGVTGLPSDDAVLRAAVEADGGDYDAVRRTTIGFSAVPSLAAGKVDAVVTFWNAEGVALRRQGVPTREFRVGRYGAPRYPELVIATTRERIERDPELLRDVLAALDDGTRDALRKPKTSVREIVAASDSEPELVAAQLAALTSALQPPIVFYIGPLDDWASFEVRSGILERKPDVERAFDTQIARRALSDY
jgi:NitT/TauT family transport system substrate-binding protein/putative hydroxymethylpyrimidine transport system substrate-binding protein